MKLTDEQRGRIVKAMDSSTNYIAMLAAGVRELAKVYDEEKANITNGAYAEIEWIDLTEMRKTLEQAADDLEAK